MIAAVWLANATGFRAIVCLKTVRHHGGYRSRHRIRPVFQDSQAGFGVCFGVHFGIGTGRFGGHQGRNGLDWETGKCPGIS
jgi:hypothetical protein